MFQLRNVRHALIYCSNVIRVIILCDTISLYRYKYTLHFVNKHDKHLIL